MLRYDAVCSECLATRAGCDVFSMVAKGVCASDGALLDASRPLSPVQLAVDTSACRGIRARCVVVRFVAVRTSPSAQARLVGLGRLASGARPFGPCCPADPCAGSQVICSRAAGRGPLGRRTVSVCPARPFASLACVECPV